MTKDEAIEMLKHCAAEYHCKDRYFGRHMCEKCNQRIAQDMAIESLKTEAIPVEWLKEKLTGHPEISYALTDAIITVLEAWEQRKEE